MRLFSYTAFDKTPDLNATAHNGHYSKQCARFTVCDLHFSLGRPGWTADFVLISLRSGSGSMETPEFASMAALQRRAACHVRPGRSTRTSNDCVGCQLASASCRTVAWRLALFCSLGSDGHHSLCCECKLYMSSSAANAINPGRRQCYLQTVLPSLSILQDSPELQCGLDTKYQRLHIKLDDLDHANLLLHMEAAVDFIQAAIAAGGSVLVHCAAGISRSATVWC